IVGLAQHAAKRRTGTECIEVAARDKFHVNPLQVGSATDPAMRAEQNAADRSHIRERLIFLPELPEKRIGKELPASVRQSIYAAYPLSLAKHNELLRLAHGQPPQHDRVQ